MGPARCGAAATGAWYDQRGRVLAHTCAEHQELAGHLLSTAPGRSRRLDRWLPANVAWSHPTPAAPVGKAYQLTLTLDGVSPPIWRRIHVPAAWPLNRLHEVVQVAMGWSGFHLWRFGPALFGDLRGEYAPESVLEEVLRKPGDVLGYEYDFGDQWLHHLELDKIVTRPRRDSVLPRCSAGKRAAPPEDSGGPWGYEELLRGLRARKGLRYRRARELCGPGFDPEAFDRAGVNTALAALAD